MKACKGIARGYNVFLDHAIVSPRKTLDPFDVELVREYSDVFP